MKKSLALTLFASLAAFAQNPLIGDAKGTWDMIKVNLAKSADKMPEEHYSFKPTPEVRSFGQLVGHVANANFRICSRAHTEKPPAEDIEKTVTAKADLVKALNASIAYCDAAHAGMTDAAATEAIKMFNRDMTKLGVLNFNTMHDFEHYGNMVTYMRMKGLVPPSSER